MSHVTQRRIASQVYACWTEWEAQVPSQRKAQVRATHFPGKDSVQLHLRSQDNPFCSPEESVSSSIWCVYSSTVIRGGWRHQKGLIFAPKEGGRGVSNNLLKDVAQQDAACFGQEDN